MDTLVLLAAIPLGLIAGGFVTMLVDRVPDATPLTWSSRCPHCAHRLGPAETVPVVSWFVRHGHCRHCDEPITPAYPVVELVTMALWVAVAATYGWDWRLLPPLVMVTSLTALSVIDMYVYRLPDRLVFSSLAVAAVSMVVAAIGIDHLDALTRAAAGMIGYGALFLVLHLISPRALGFGDVKLSLLLGLFLGWTGGSEWLGWTPVVRLVFYGLLIACFLGVVGGLLLGIARRRVKVDVLVDPEATEGQPDRLLSQSMPFGPALAAGTVIAVLFADSIV